MHVQHATCVENESVDAPWEAFDISDVCRQRSSRFCFSSQASLSLSFCFDTLLCIQRPFLPYHAIMASTFLSFALLIPSLTSTVYSASVHNHARLHNLRYRSLAVRDTPPPTGWEVKGCYTDDSTSRTLYSLSTSADNMTTESCIGYCSTNGYPLAGTEYGRECYCSKSIAVSGSVAASADCSFPCAGNNNQICGGNSRLTIYHNISDVASAKPPATNAGPPGWGFLGCYVDSQVARTLPYGATTAGGANNMTVANCAQECQRQNYQYSGVEYGGECYCGNSLPNSQLAPDGLAGCSRTCYGNSTE